MPLVFGHKPAERPVLRQLRHRLRDTGKKSALGRAGHVRRPAKTGHGSFRRHQRFHGADLQDGCRRREPYPGLRDRRHRKGHDAVRRRGHQAHGRRRHGPVRRPGRCRGSRGARLLRRPGGSRCCQSNGRSRPANTCRHMQRPGHPAQDRAGRRRLRCRGHHGPHSGAVGTAGRARHRSAGAADCEPGDRHRQRRVARPGRLEGNCGTAAGLPPRQRHRPSLLDRPVRCEGTVNLRRSRGRTGAALPRPGTGVGRPGAGGRAGGRCRDGQIAPVA